MNQHSDEQPLAAGRTHRVENQPPPLENYDSYGSDRALQDFVAAHDADWADRDLHALGVETGSREMIEHGFLANEYLPVLHTHDRFGHRIDEVRYHPSYHVLMRRSIEMGLHASPWREPRAGAHVARAARYYLQAQVEAGHGCPITMTFAALPTLRKQPDLAAEWEPLVTALQYDPANKPWFEKAGVTIGMAMTEKQGGSDVRANTTRARPLTGGGGGQVYELTGHKWFVSAPMCDAFLVLAQADGGLSCFLVPRWLPNGRRNGNEIMRLKRKMGNVSNASSEQELRGARGLLIGEEGRGVANILEMVALTRFDCMIGSSAGMRQALVQALHHCRHRVAFGAVLDRQPLMQNVLADLALESEAALAFTLRIARALDHPEDDHERQVLRIGTAVGKYWICKRTPGHAYEAMECVGGSGLVEECIMPRLLRESPVNAIWEGSGNIQALDMLRAVRKTPRALDGLLEEVSVARGHHPLFDRWVDELAGRFEDREDLQYRARDLVGRLALAIQASQLLRHSPDFVGEAFCASRLSAGPGGYQYGCLPRGVPCAAILERALG